jgi:hypothetical protein
VSAVRASDIAHFVFGVLAPLLGHEWLFTTIYLFYQVIDLIGDRNVEEVKNDIIEYALGLIAGLFMRCLFARALAC